MLELSMEWETCPDGVEVDTIENTRQFIEDRLKVETDWHIRTYLDAIYRTMDSEGEVYAPKRSVQFIRYRTGTRRRILYSMEDLSAPVVMDLANTKDLDGLLLFVYRYGLSEAISNEDPIASQRLDYLQDDLAMFRRLVQALSGDIPPAEVVTVINRELATRITPAAAPSLELPAGADIPKLVFRPSTPRGFMLMEIAVAASVGARKAECEHCDKWFLTGPRTGRRSHARFCSDRCRVAAMRKRKASEAQ